MRWEKVRFDYLTVTVLAFAGDECLKIHSFVIRAKINQNINIVNKEYHKYIYAFYRETWFSKLKRNKFHLHVKITLFCNKEILLNQE